MLTKGELRDMLKDEQSVRLVTNQLMCLGRDVRTSPMYWSYEGKKLDAGVKHLSWCPPWVDRPADNEDSDLEEVDEKLGEGNRGGESVRPSHDTSQGQEGRSHGEEKSPRRQRLGSKYIGENELVSDHVGLGRTASMWWTQNCKYNAAHDVHRLNVDGMHAFEALDTGVDSYRGVRQAFARDCPDLVAYQIVLRTELIMRIVMPSVIKHSKRWPYKCMARFETGTLGGNLHAHGFSCGDKPPRMPRRVKAQQVEDGDETSEGGSENDDMPEDGGNGSTTCHGEDKSGLVGLRASSDADQVASD